MWLIILLIILGCRDLLFGAYSKWQRLNYNFHSNVKSLCYEKIEDEVWFVGEYFMPLPLRKSSDRSIYENKKVENNNFIFHKISWVNEGKNQPVLIACGEEGVVWIKEKNRDYLLRRVGDTILRDIWVDESEGKVWIVGDNNTLLVSADKTTDFKLLRLPLADGYDLFSIGGYGKTILIGGERGVLLRSEDNGRNFKKVNIGCNNLFSCIFWYDKDTVWIGANKGRILFSKDGGKSWGIYTTPADVTIFGLYFRTKEEGWAVGGKGTILYTKDGGRNWTREIIPGISEDFYAIAATKVLIPATTVYAPKYSTRLMIVGEGGLVLYKYLWEDLIPTSNELLQNYPNPCNPGAWLPFKLSERGHVMINIYNIVGQRVATLDLGMLEPANYTEKEDISSSLKKAPYWNGRNKFGEEISSGVYFYSLEVNGRRCGTKSLAVIK